MEKKKVYTAIGLMSGTSLDGIDAALIKTDGHGYVEVIGFVSIPYDEELREKLRACLGAKTDPDGRIGMVEIEMTRAHAAAVDWLLGKTGMNPQDIDVVGFHGQTLYHDPDNAFTWQIGNGAMLARLTGIDVVNDLRSADMKEGGQGAPLLPLYHHARAEADALEKPVAILNIGGVSNVTYLGRNGEVIAFDTGPGNALLDDWVKKHLNRPYDKDGMLARQGKIDQDVLAKCLNNPFFAAKTPKSLDRDAWDARLYQHLGAADGAATLSAFTVNAIAKALDHLPEPPKTWYVSGGGRLNPILMEGLRKIFNVAVKPVDDLGWNGDAVEAEGFAYLAVRSLLKLPLSLPTTTGVSKPVTGGVLYEWKNSLG